MARTRKTDKGNGGKSKAFTIFEGEDHTADDSQEDLPKDEAGRRKIKRQYEELLAGSRGGMADLARDPAIAGSAGTSAKITRESALAVPAEQQLIAGSAGSMAKIGRESA